MFDFLLQLAIATILVLLTTTVMQMVSVLVKLAILDLNAMILVNAIQMGLLTTTVMQMVSVLVKLAILDKNAINIDVLDGKS